MPGVVGIGVQGTLPKPPVGAGVVGTGVQGGGGGGGGGNFILTEASDSLMTEASDNLVTET